MYKRIVAFIANSSKPQKVNRMKFQDRKVLEHWLKHRGHSSEITAGEVEWYYKYREFNIIGYCGVVLAVIGAILHFGQVGTLNIKNGIPLGLPALVVLVGVLVAAYISYKALVSNRNSPDVRLRGVAKQLEHDIDAFRDLIDSDPTREDMDDLHFHSVSMIGTLGNLLTAPNTKPLDKAGIRLKLHQVPVVASCFVSGAVH